MSDKESTDADYLRQAKLVAARKKLRKFQSKKLDHHPQANAESCGSKSSHDEPKTAADGVLFSNHGSPLTRRSDGLPVDVDLAKTTSSNSQPFTMVSPPPPLRASPSAILSSSPPPPPPAFSVLENSISSPPSQPLQQQHQSIHLSSPTSPISAHGTSIFSPPDPLLLSHRDATPPHQSNQLLQDRIDALQQEKAGLVSQSEQLQQQLTDLNRQYDAMKDQKADATQQHDTLAETHHLLELQYGEVKQQLLESNAAIQSQQVKLAELQTSLASAQDQIREYQQTKQDNEIQREQAQEVDKRKWGELSVLVETQTKELAEMKASNEDFHTETTRLIDMVNNLEEELARTQADNYSKDCEIKSLNAQLYDLAQGNHGSLVADLEQKTQERDTLRQVVKRLEVDQRRLDSLAPELDALKDRLTAANQELATMNHQLEEKDDVIRNLQLALDNKQSDHNTQLSELQLAHDTVKEAADKWQQQTSEIQHLLDSKNIEYSELATKHDDFEMVISKLKQQLRDADISSNTKDEQIDYMKGSIQQLEQQHDTMKQQLLDTKQLVDTNEQTIIQLRDYIKKLEQIHIVLTRDLDSAHEAQKAYDKTLEASSVDFDNLQQQYNALNETLNEKETLYQELLKTKDGMSRRLTETQSNNQQHQQLMTGCVDRINQKVAHINTMYEKMERTTTEIEAKIMTTVMQQTNHSEQTATQSEDLEVMRQTLALTESQAKTYRDKLMELESRSLEQQLYIDKLETDQQSFNEQRKFLEQELTQLQEELDEKRELADMFEDARASLVNEQTSLTSRLKEQQVLVSDLNTQLQNRNNDIGELQEKIKMLQSAREGATEGEGGWEQRHQDLEQRLKDQTAAQQTLIDEREQQEASLNDIKKTMKQLQIHADNLEQQLASERTASAAANDELKQQLIALSDNSKNNNNNNNNSNSDSGSQDDDDGNSNQLLQQERNQRQRQVELLENQLTDLQEQLMALQDKAQEQQRLYDDKHQQWMAEQDKVASMTEDINKLQLQLQQHLEDQQALQRQLDERDQASKADDSTHLSNQHKGTQNQATVDSNSTDESQAQLAASGFPLTENKTNSNGGSGSEREQALEMEVNELRSRLERQFDAFTTIRGELTTVRDRQLNAEREAAKEKNDLVRQRQGLEHTIERLRDEYQEHLERMWEQHEAIRQHHEEDLTVGRDALDSAQVKLMQNGLSPVSENGFEWVNSDSEQEDDNGDSPDGATSSNNQTPSVGRLPPLRKPDFFEFLETPRCNGCQSEVIDI